MPTFWNQHVHVCVKVYVCPDWGLLRQAVQTIKA